MVCTPRMRARGRAASAAGLALLLAMATSAVAARADEGAAAAPRQLAQAPREADGGGSTRHVEARIADLHKKLAITPEQEAPFNAYAELMRANAQTMAALFRQRAENRDLSAPGILRWYAQLTTAHADGLNKLLPAFDALYAVLSDKQKKAADAAFVPLRQGRRPRRAG